ncbi:MAG: 1,4-dihydroxy-2-naphthoate polyprenyltransferase [Myxococcota bacterium]|nr:1,4-dihydroxy-2-naphthoate polyprenyltransferase [Myxococcota bacterium]
MNTIPVDLDRPSTPRIWLQAIRPGTLTAGVVPVVVGSALAYAHGHFRWSVAVAAVLAAFAVQVMTNLHNDYEDYIRGADTEARLGQARAVQKGWLTARQILGGVGLAAIMGIGCAIYLFVVAGWPVVAIALASMLAALAYTGGPFPLAYVGLGDLFVLLFFGIVAVCGTYYVHAQTVTGAAMVAAIAVGLMATAILVVNNLRDRHTDVEANKNTLVVRFGQRFGRLEYTLCLLMPFGLVGVGSLSHIGTAGWWLPWVCLPLALRLIRSIWTIDGRALNAYLGKTAGLGCLFGGLLAIGAQF